MKTKHFLIIAVTSIMLSIIFVICLYECIDDDLKREIATLKYRCDLLEQYQAEQLAVNDEETQRHA